MGLNSRQALQKNAEKIWLKVMTKKGNKVTFQPLSGWRMPVLVGLMVLLAGCTAPRELGDPEENALKQRVIARWACLARNDFECVYTFTTPAYQQVFSQEMYANQPVSMLSRRLTGVQVLAYDGDAAVASVAVRVMSEPVKYTSSASRALGGTTSTISETWVWRSGKCCYVEAM